MIARTPRRSSGTHAAKHYRWCALVTPWKVVFLGFCLIAFNGTFCRLWRVKDGDTRSLKLDLTDGNETTLTRDSWIQLNASSQSVYGLPLDDDAGFHQFLLTAFNRRNRSVSTPLEVLSSHSISSSSWMNESMNDLLLHDQKDWKISIQSTKGWLILLTDKRVGGR